MAAYFFDSSALVKGYVAEIGTAWVRGILSPAAGNDIHVLSLTEIEVIAAVARRGKLGTVSPTDATTILTQLEHDFSNEFVVIDLSDALLSSAKSLVKQHELRANDGLQLAALLMLNQTRVSAGLAATILVSADQELNAAAQVEGAGVEDPNNHP